MMDPETTNQLMTIGKAIGIGTMGVKLLGPTVDYLGQGIRNWTERRYNNINAIFSAAVRKIGDRIEEDGAVPPRVLKEILDEGSFAEDEVVQDYFGGVLASSRSTISRDDRGLVFARLVSRMSTYMVRFHYVIYTTIKQFYDGSARKIGAGETGFLKVFIPWGVLTQAMDFAPEEDSIAIIGHVLFGLAKEDLIGDFKFNTDPEQLSVEEHFHKNVTAGGGLYVAASTLGIELFLWAQGVGDLRTTDYLSPDYPFSEVAIIIPEGSVPLNTP